MSAPEKNPVADRPQIQIWTDGGCKPNPGPGGYGVVLVHAKKRKEISGGFRKTTNNRMEIIAAIRALEILKRPCVVTLHSDSQYVVNAMSKGWALKWKQRNWWRTKDSRAANPDLWERLLALCETHQVSFQWLRGHAGHAENERCDVLSTQAREKSGLPADEGFEKADAFFEKEMLL